MKTKYLACTQAYAIQNEYKYLVGSRLSSGELIETVTVAPYSRILKWQFVKKLLSGVKADDMLGTYINGRYDVILVFRSTSDPNGFIIKDLRDYLAEAGIPFEYRYYECLRTITGSDFVQQV